MMTRYHAAISCALVVLFVRACRSEFHLVVMHTNDVHAHVQQTTIRGSLCTPEDEQEQNCVGGVTRRQTLIQQIRQQPTSSILLDAGDQFQGTLWFQVYQGAEASHFMNLLGYEAMALGNHDFDNGVAGVVDFLDNVTFPVLAATIDWSDEPLLQDTARVQATTEIDKDGETIGIVGYITEETPFLVDPDGISNLRFHSVVQTIETEVRRFEENGINKIIALGHAGYTLDKVIAAIEGVDIVVGGHSHSLLYTGDQELGDDVVGDYPTIVDQPDGGKGCVVQAFANGKFLGVLNVTFTDDGKVTSCTGNPVLLDHNIPEDDAVSQEVMKWAGMVDEKGFEVVGESLVFLDGERTSCRLGECNLGNFVTEAIVHYYVPSDTSDDVWTNASVAFWNGGGIRSSIGQGTIRTADLYSVFPFGNTVERVRISGKTLRAVLEHSVGAYSQEDPKGSFLQMAGVHVSYNLSQPSGSRVKDVWVRCASCSVPAYEPLRPDQRYNVLTSGFLIGGGDGFTILERNVEHHLPYGDIVPDILRKYLTVRSPVTQGLERRIVLYGEPRDPDDDSAAPGGGSQCHWPLLFCIQIAVWVVVNSRCI